MSTATVELEREERAGASMGPIRTSRTLGKLAGALALAQAEFPPIGKDRTARVESKKGEGSSYSYAYADLSDVLSAVRPCLSKNGLAILQPMAWNGAPRLVTCLVHSSGEWIESEYQLTEYERPQDMGSAITYARRYALTALLGIAAEDDDDGQRAQVGPQRGKETLPPCPACGTPERVIVSKFGAGYYCHTCKGKFGDLAVTPEPPGAKPSTSKAVAVSAGRQFDPNRDDPAGHGGYPDDPEYPNDHTAHDRHGVEPAKQAEKVAQKPATGSDMPACPHCGASRGVMVSKFPGKGSHFCRPCGSAFNPSAA